VSNKIIAICGPSGSGKSTLAQLIQKNEGGVVTSFSHPIKMMLFDLVTFQGCSPDITARMIYGDLKETPSEYLGGRTPRYAMQTLGTEWGRNLLHTDLWIAAWKRNLGSIVDQHDVIVDDLRFLSEEKAVRTFRNSVIIRIARKDDKTAGDHSSEKEYTRICVDVMITNDSTPEDMYGVYKYYMSLNEKKIPHDTQR
jgi:energy-coupling factor transporter ATP-binding protein EcfA2